MLLVGRSPVNQFLPCRWLHAQEDFGLCRVSLHPLVLLCMPHILLALPPQTWPTYIYVSRKLNEFYTVIVHDQDYLDGAGF